MNETLKKVAKEFIRHNVWDGEDRFEGVTDWANFNPDELQELINDLVDTLFQEKQMEGKKPVCKNIDEYLTFKLREEDHLFLIQSTDQIPLVVS